MDEPKDIEAWADALLDQHRTTPRGSAAGRTDPAPPADDPLLLRVATKLSGQAADPHVRERYLRSLERHATFQKFEAAATLLGVLLLVGFAVVFFSLL